MPIPLKSPRDIDQMRRAGAMLRRVLDEAVAQARPGTRTRDLDALIAARIREAGAEPIAQKSGFPGAASITINEEAAHAPPGARMLRDGDAVSIDAALRFDGWCADAARAIAVGEAPSPLTNAAQSAFAATLSAMHPGRRWSAAVQAAASVATAHACRIVPNYSGHGIGRELHELPAAPYISDTPSQTRDWDFTLRPGMVLTVEPILVQGRPDLLTLDDGWTVVTADRSWAAHEERTIAITRNGALDLTAP
jgi:methionyl aminopeptidase